MNYHALSRGNKWTLHRTGGKRALAIYTTRKEAWREARRRARAEHTVAYLHDKSGRIVTRNSYEIEDDGGKDA